MSGTEQDMEERAVVEAAKAIWDEWANISQEDEDFSDLTPSHMAWYVVMAKASISAYKAVMATCPVCNGNDADMPCAYPSENQEGCLRDKRFNTRNTQPPNTDKNQPENVGREERLANAIKDVLDNYKVWNLPLTDLLTPEGDKDISRGKWALESLHDDICGAVTEALQAIETNKGEK